MLSLFPKWSHEAAATVLVTHKKGSKQIAFSKAFSINTLPTTCSLALGRQYCFNNDKKVFS